MSARRTALAGLIPVAFQSISLANSTAIGLNSTVRATADVLDISVETADVRYRADGTDPTLTTGVLIQSDTWQRWQGFNKTSALKFQRSTGTALVSVMAWRHAGGNLS
jgi:hypothetical protein